MSHDALKLLLESSKLPFAYKSWPEKGAPPLPYGVFSYPNSSNFGADGVVYFSANRVLIDLYTKTKQPDVEKQLENVLDGAGIFWERTEIWVASERMFLNRYEIEV